MVLKSKKSKSKRTTLKHKYKVIKKVKQHLKKKAKEEKKARASGKKIKAPKDPGIPSQWPFKEELLKDLEWQKQRILDQEKSRKASNKLKRVRIVPLLKLHSAPRSAHSCCCRLQLDFSIESSESRQQRSTKLLPCTSALLSMAGC